MYYEGDGDGEGDDDGDGDGNGDVYSDGDVYSLGGIAVRWEIFRTDCHEGVVEEDLTLADVLSFLQKLFLSELLETDLVEVTVKDLVEQGGLLAGNLVVFSLEIGVADQVEEFSRRHRFVKSLAKPIDETFPGERSYMD